MAETGSSHGLGFGNGSLIEYSDGTVEHRKTMELYLAFKVRVRDVVGFTVRRPTRDDKKRLNASSLGQVLALQGSGTTLAEVALNYGTAEKIEEWFRAHPDFGRTRQAQSPAPPHSQVSSVLKLDRWLGDLTLNQRNVTSTPIVIHGSAKPPYDHAIQGGQSLGVPATNQLPFERSAI